MKKTIDYRIAAMPDERVPKRIRVPLHRGIKIFPAYLRISTNKIADGAFSIPLLKDTALSEREVEALYQLDMTKIESCMVKTAAVQARAWRNCIVSGEEGT